MHKRMLQLIGGLLAVAAMAIVPATASAGGSSGCDDHYGPHSYWGHGWYGHDGDGPYWRGWDDGNGYFGGRSWDGYCNSSDRRGKVDRVMVAVQRLRGSRCQHLRSNGRLGRRTDCSDLHWLRASGTKRWRYSIPRHLPRGHYRLHHRAFDAAGNHGKHRRRHVFVR